MVFISPFAQKNKMSKEKDKLLMPPPPPRLMPLLLAPKSLAKGMLEQLPPLPPLMLCVHNSMTKQPPPLAKGMLEQLPPLMLLPPLLNNPPIMLEQLPKPLQKVSFRTSNASITLLSLNPPAKPIKPKQVTFFEIQVKQKLMETVRMHSIAYVEPSSPLTPLDLVQKLLLAAKPF